MANGLSAGTFPFIESIPYFTLTLYKKEEATKVKLGKWRKRAIKTDYDWFVRFKIIMNIVYVLRACKKSCLLQNAQR